MLGVSFAWRPTIVIPVNRVALESKRYNRGATRMLATING